MLAAVDSQHHSIIPLSYMCDKHNLHVLLNIAVSCVFKKVTARGQNICKYVLNCR